ncbi:hypothetical protein KA062_00535 [Patescibacteria group bacterium]|jgi:hypothetical protein|nr:hypothetical protein [Patescibacteria group bacterium]
MNNVEISPTPNYVTEDSRSVEIQMKKILETAVSYGIDISSEILNRETLLNSVRNHVPERYQLVSDKLATEGLILEQLDDKTIYDRMLGIDYLIRFNGHLIAIDVTSGNGTLLYNKKRKFEELKPVFDDLGISHAVVISLKGGITDDQVISIFEKIDDLKDYEFTTVLKYRNELRNNL